MAFNIITTTVAVLSFLGSLLVHWSSIRNIKKENQKNRIHAAYMQLGKDKTVDELWNLVNDPVMTKILSKIENTNLEKLKNKKIKKINGSIIKIDSVEKVEE